MKTAALKVRGRLGDFWWYTLMLFIASRAADLLNAFVGLWIVPKFIAPEELGAVMPLAQFAGLVATPAAIFASTFRNELSSLAVARKYGEMKSLMRGVFIGSAVFLVVSIALCRLVLPAFLQRIRIVEGSLGMLVFATAIVGAVSPVYQNALQALKKFKAVSAINIVGAPVRLIAMVVAMPFRPLSGYFVGQAATPAFNIIASVFFLRKELAVKAVPYWKSTAVRRFAKLFALMSTSALAGAVATLVENMVLRQRLPAIESAGYYMATRFSDISGYLAAAVVFAIFPFAAEMNATGRDYRPLMKKICLALLAFSAPLALLFALLGETVLSVLPHGDEYKAFWWAIPWAIGVATLTHMVSVFTTIKVAAYKFGYYVWMIPLTLAYPAALLLAAERINTLSGILICMTSFAAAKMLCCIVAMTLEKPVSPPSKESPPRA